MANFIHSTFYTLKSCKKVSTGKTFLEISIDIETENFQNLSYEKELKKLSRNSRTVPVIYTYM